MKSKPVSVRFEIPLFDQLTAKAAEGGLTLSQLVVFLVEQALAMPAAVPPPESPPTLPSLPPQLDLTPLLERIDERSAWIVWSLLHGLGKQPSELAMAFVRRNFDGPGGGNTP